MAVLMSVIFFKIIELLSCILTPTIVFFLKIYTLLYKREVFQPLADHQAFQDLSQNLQTVSWKILN